MHDSLDITLDISKTYQKLIGGLLGTCLPTSSEAC